MSDEPENLIDDVFMQKLGVKYPFVRAADVNQLYQIAFFPSVYCIGPDGNILTVPQDRLPGEAFLEEQLKNVSLAPKMPADSRFDALRAMWEKKEHKKLADHLDKLLAQPNLDAELRTIYTAQQAALQQRHDRQVARVAELEQGPDFAVATESLEKVQRDWKGLPPADAATAALQRLAKSPTIQKEIAAGRALAKLLPKFDTSKSSQKQKLIEELDKFAKKHAGTHAGKTAEAMRTDLLTSR